ncbi:Uncharacterized conserved protein, DUF2252 family [Microbacterium sp. cf046]|uniref:DUF2252 domain-containing protein n=1 Tax=Microbacterium sp. cf046 TaxID=1761803 RepID=UPI0008ED8604|nr:DUF2252 domain-containing protein [Microbacterium sp. cf046]SFS14956.1 Uncharacterized conserved protein, DUF2252 family [Microbacterium sp. cf046]
MPLDAPDLLKERAHFSRAESRELGKSLRRVIARSELAEHRPVQRDAVAHLREQNATRVPELVPVRMERMLASPFAFYRGTAGLMALDLGKDPHSGILVAACGDAHISNFGFYASPERQLVFDLNDFDEAAVAPWEWDLKRLITSVIVGGREAGYHEPDVEKVARRAVAQYIAVLRSMVELSPTGRYFMHLNVDSARRQLSRDGRRVLNAALAAAERRTSVRAIRRTTEREPDGKLRFVENPPTMVRFRLDDATPLHAGEPPESIHALFAQYRDTVSIDVDTVLAQYEPTDLARRVVGVGSVGTRCYLQLLQGADEDALLLQVKEAGESVLSQYGHIPQPARITDGVAASGEGFRVVGMQRVLQAVSDPFLGHLQANGRAFYVRQFHDMKGSVELDGLPLDAYSDYVIACAGLLGRAHAQSPTAGQVLGYVGRSDAATRAIVAWSVAYADQSLRDYETASAATW